MTRGQGDAQFPAQQQVPPGLTEDMVPGPDHGEDSYRGMSAWLGAGH